MVELYKCSICLFASIVHESFKSEPITFSGTEFFLESSGVSHEIAAIKAIFFIRITFVCMHFQAPLNSIVKEPIGCETVDKSGVFRNINPLA